MVSNVSSHPSPHESYCTSLYSVSEEEQMGMTSCFCLANASSSANQSPSSLILEQNSL